MREGGNLSLKRSGYFLMDFARLDQNEEVCITELMLDRVKAV